MTYPSRPSTTVVIIGAGFSGIAMGCELTTRLGIDDYCVYDRYSGIGGAWFANTYPGCAVDIPGFCYSLSFAPNPDFSQIFPPQREILQYLSNVAQHYGVDRHFCGMTEWRGSTWSDATRTWTTELEDLSTGIRHIQESRILISCVGGLVNPRGAGIPSLELFSGGIMHTSKWNHDINIRNKRVLVIGNGASASQLIPAIAGKPKSLTQIVRTPQHLIPSCNHDVPPLMRAVLQFLPGLLFLIRTLIFCYMEITFLYFQTSNLGRLGRAMSEKACHDHIQKTAPAEYWSLLTPSYRFGCRRRIFDQAYTATLHRSNVRLIRDRILKVKKRSVVTENGGEIPVDVIILATGFALTQYDVNLRGRSGRTREQHWREYGHKSAFKSVAMNGFPNFFFVLGPNSGTLHTSAILSIEMHISYILKVLQPIIQTPSGVVEVKKKSEDHYSQRLVQALDRTVHDGSCSSILIDQKTGKNWFVYPWNSLQMWLSTQWDSLGDWTYELPKS